MLYVFNKTTILLVAWQLTSSLSAIWIVSTILRKFFGLRIIGLTGSIATGKSTCSTYIARHGYHIIDVDSIGHDIYAVNTPTWKAVRAEFGDEILEKDWSINRKKLGNIVWKDRAKLNKLTSLTKWPIMKETILQILIAFLLEQCQVIILDCPLLFESKWMAYICDSIIVVYVTQNIQYERLQKRDGIDKEQAKLKIEKQLSVEEKKKKKKKRRYHY